MAMIRKEGNVQIVALSGDITIGKSELGRPLDLHGKPLEDAGDVLERAMSVAPPKVVLDLRQVRFMDSAGIGDLLRWKQRAMRLGGDIKLVVQDGAVKTTLNLMSLEKIFAIFEDESEAIASYRGTTSG